MGGLALLDVLVELADVPLLLQPAARATVMAAALADKNRAR
jgi:hypothetical protein